MHSKEDASNTEHSPVKMNDGQFSSEDGSNTDKIPSTWDKIPCYVKFLMEYTTFTILGNFTREGITALSNYDHSYIEASTVLWSNCVACIVMGLLQELNQAKWFKDHPELFTSLTTGFCGSLSSYSTMMLEIFEHSASLTPGNISQSYHLPNRAYGIMEFLSVLLTHLFISMASLIFGRKLSTDVIIPYCSDGNETIDEIDNKAQNSESPPNKFVKAIFSLLAYGSFICAVPFIALIVTLAGVYDNYSRGDWTLPAMFGIIGSFTRYYVSQYLNPVLPNFPLGTFTANEFAVTVLAALNMVIRGKRSHHERNSIIKTVNGCHVVSALATGYCGSLSTISTFINEGYKMKFLHMMRYYLSSIAVSYCIYVIMLGSLAWSRGLTEPMC